MLGFVSLFMDISSESIHSLLPVFMVSTLGASMTTVGVLMGVTDAIGLLIKIFSGTLSDYYRKRKLFALIGYGLSALTKSLFPLANSIGLVFTARFFDRVGKGIREAPVEALVGEIAPPNIRGACFGLRQSLDTVGAFLGPILAILGMYLLADNIRTVLWIAVIPAFVAVFILAVGVEEPKIPPNQPSASRPKILQTQYFSKSYWQLVGIAGLLMLARFSDAFLIIKAKSIGLPLTLIPLVLVVMNIIFAFASYPAGILADKVNRKTVLLIGIAFLVAANIVLSMTNNLWMMTLAISLWGMHLAFTQGQLSTMVTDTTSPEHRGTSYGIFNFVSGIAMLLSSIIAGVLWDHFGASFTFITSGIVTSITFIGLLVIYGTSKE
jgi:MFS family permease